jgi:hypothetical protein
MKEGSTIHKRLLHYKRIRDKILEYREENCRYKSKPGYNGTKCEQLYDELCVITSKIAALEWVMK